MDSKITNSIAQSTSQDVPCNSVVKSFPTVCKHLWKVLIKIFFVFFLKNFIIWFFIEDALNKYNEKNNCLPDRIFVYRDGVSDGQFEGVSQFEVPQMKRAFTEVNELYK